MNNLVDRIISIAKKIIFPTRYFRRMYPYTYMDDGLATIHNCEFIKEPSFQEAYKVAKATGSWFGCDLIWRSYIVFWLANFVKHLEGDFVECGVNKGGFARGIIQYTKFQEIGKKFYLFDTFEGFVEKYVSEKEKENDILSVYAKHYTDCYDEVKKTFAEFNVEIVKGPVPETLTHVEIDKVSFLSIDMNCTAPEVAALNFFWEKLTPGAVIILDDYGNMYHVEQKKAHDEFARQKGINILCLPTAQGIIFKPF
jgi:O-methyltransferase